MKVVLLIEFDHSASHYLCFPFASFFAFAHNSQAPRLTAFEFLTSSETPNILLWISGLTEGLLCPTYITSLASTLPGSWSAAQVLLSSSYSGWGTSSLVDDASELAQCVSYFRTIKPANGKIVLMGHSTGCQDVMEYLVGPGAPERPLIDGGILQASISDRESIQEDMDPDTYEKSVRIAREMIAKGKGEDIMPQDVIGDVFDDPCCARRWLSLASPDGNGEDDYFSSDLSDEQLRSTFGKIPKHTPISILYSGSDEFVPEFVNREALVNKWLGFVAEGGGIVGHKFSAVIEGASHNYEGNPESVVKDLTNRIAEFLQWIEVRDSS